MKKWIKLKGKLLEKEKSIIIEFAYERKWDKKIAKKVANRIETLLIHHLKTLNILEKVFYLTKDALNLSADDLRLVLLAAFIHDTGKEKDEWQDKITKGITKYVPHVEKELSNEIINRIVDKLEWKISKDKTSEVINIIMQHMEAARKNPEETLKSILRSSGDLGETKWVTLTHLLVFADRLASIVEPQHSKTIFEGKGLKRLSDLIEIEYHQLNQLRGITTTLLHHTLEEFMKENNWDPILYFPNGTIYLRRKSESNKENQWEKFDKKLKEKLNVFFDSFQENESETLVGNPTAQIITSSRLFNWNHLENYFEIAKKRTGIKPLSSVKSDQIEKYITARTILVEQGFDAANNYLTNPTKYKEQYNEIKVTINEGSKEYQKVKAEMTEINPEATLFKLFKAIFDDNMISTPVMVDKAKEKFEAIFGEEHFERLQSMSTLQPARDRITAIDNYWSLNANKLIENENNELIKSKPAGIRQEILKKVLLKIAKEVYEETGTEYINAYHSILIDIAKLDVIHPRIYEGEELTKLCEGFLEYWKESKHAQLSKSTKLYICPRCNHQYNEENLVAEKISGFKKKFSNRAIGGTRKGSGLSICNQCELELILRHLASKSQVVDLVILYPEISIHREFGEKIQTKINSFEKGLENRSLYKDEDPYKVFSFWNIITAANTIVSTPIFLEKLEKEQKTDDFLDLFTYRRSEDSAQKTLQKTFEKILVELEIKLEKKPIVNSVKEAIQIITQINEEIIPKYLEELFYNNLPSERKNIQFFYQTPNFFIWSTNQTLGGSEEESEVNLYLKKLFIGTLIALFTNYSVAILNPDEIIPNRAEGKVYIPSNNHIRQLFDNKEWLADPKIIDTSGMLAAAILLARRADYPSRSNIYSVLKEKVKGKILRRIEMIQKNIISSDIENLELLIRSEEKI